MDNRFRVLVADPFSPWRGLLEYLLSEKGYEVVALDSAQDAEDRIRNGTPHFHVVIADIQCTSNPADDLKRAQHTILDLVRDMDTYTCVIIMVSAGVPQDQVTGLVAAYKDLQVQYVFKFPDQHKEFDLESFVATVNTFCIKAAEPVRCLALLPDAASSKRVREQIHIAVDDVRRRHIECLTVPFNIKAAQDQVLSAIQEAEIVIADVTDLIGDIAYELGICDALGKKIILLAQESQSIPRYLEIFRPIRYSLDGWRIDALGADVKESIEDNIDRPDDPHALGKRQWSPEEIETHRVLMLGHSESERGDIFGSDVYRSFIHARLRLKGLRPDKFDRTLDSRPSAELLWREINQAGIILADLSSIHPDVLYAVGLAHAQGRPVVILTSHAEALPLALTGANAIEYSQEPDESREQLRAQIDSRLAGILALYNDASRGLFQPLPPTPMPVTVSPRYRGMPQMKKGTIAWLHLSDLHVGCQTGHRDWKILKQALLTDLRAHQDPPSEQPDRRAGVEFHPDFIFVTGDVAYRGLEKEYSEAESLLESIWEITGLGKEQTFIVPGNHDVKRAFAEEDVLHRTIYEVLSGESKPRSDWFDRLCMWWDDPRFVDLIGKKFASYLTFVKKCTSISTDKPYYTKSLQVAGQDLTVLGVNSAIMSWTDGEDRERNLWIGMPQVDELVGSVQAQSSTFRIALVHHPEEALHPYDIAWARLQEVSTLLLHGHMHRHRVVPSYEPGREHYRLPGGSIHQDGIWHGQQYSYGQLDLETRTLDLWLRVTKPGEYSTYIRDNQTYIDRAPDGHLILGPNVRILP